jgi:hypothetical protein
MFKVIFILILTLLFTGCGEKNFNGNANSIEDMISSLPIKEQAKFLNDFELLSYAIGEDKLIGYTIDEIKQEALNIKDFTGKKNIKFLKAEILKMKSKNLKYISLHLKHGMFSSPRAGFIYRKQYSANDLEGIINSNGSLEEYEYKQKFMKDYKLGCLKQKNATNEICECIGNSFYTHFGYKHFANTEVEMTDKYKEVLTDASRKCQQEQK